MKKFTKIGFAVGALFGVFLALGINYWFISSCADDRTPGAYFSFLAFSPGGGICQPVGPGIDGYGRSTFTEDTRIDISLSQFIMTRLVFFVLPLLIVFALIGGFFSWVLGKTDQKQAGFKTS